MRISWVAITLFSINLSCTLNSLFAVPPDNLEGSGHELGDDFDRSSGSGSGDWSEGSPLSKDSKSYVRLRVKENPYSDEGGDQILTGSRSSLEKIPDDSDLILDTKPWPADDLESDIHNVAKSKNILKNKDILAGLIAGGVVGMILAASLTAFMIYNRKRKYVVGYTLGQHQRTSS